MTASPPSPARNEPRLFREDNGLLLICLVLTALLVYAKQFKGAALTWPAVDNLPAVCRLLNPNCLRSDFFTNASSDNNPRLPYIHLLAWLSNASGLGIGGGLTIVKAILMAALPMVWLFMLTRAVRQHDRQNDRVSVPQACVFGTLIVVLLQGKLGSYLSVAWWPPLGFDPSPQNASLLLTLAGWATVSSRFTWLGALAILGGGILHPITALYATVASLLILFRADSRGVDRRPLMWGTLPTLIAMVVAGILFTSNVHLSAEEFVNIYAREAHPSHYIPSAFGHLRDLPWFASWSINIALLGLSAICLRKLGHLAWRNATLALIAYIMAVASQYLFVELWPVKLIATLGPSRFTMFGPWMSASFLLIAMGTALHRRPDNWWHRTVRDLIPPARLTLVMVVLGLGGLIACMLLYTRTGNRFDPIDAQDQSLIAFASNHTQPTDVFILPFGDLRYLLPLQANRSVVIGNGFPFSEKYFRQWNERHIAFNGAQRQLLGASGSWIGEKYTRHYRALSAEEFSVLAQRFGAKWIVIETAYAGSLTRCHGTFESDKYLVISASDMARCSS